MFVSLPTGRPPSYDCQASQSVLQGGRHRGGIPELGRWALYLTQLCLEDGFFSLSSPFLLCLLSYSKAANLLGTLGHAHFPWS